MRSAGRHLCLALIVSLTACSLSASAHADAQPPAPRRTWIVGGVAALAGTYLASALVGLVILSSHGGDCRGDCGVKEQENAGASLLVPVAGPFMATGFDPHAAALYAPLGVAQLASLAWIIGSVIRYRNLRRAFQQTHGPAVTLRGERELSLQLTPTQRGLATGLRLRF